MVQKLVTFMLSAFGVYHFVAGSFVLGPHRWIQGFGSKVYRLDIPDKIDPRYFLCLKFLGLMALMVSALTFIVAFGDDEIARIGALVFYALLFSSRSLLRYAFQDEFVAAYNLEFSRSLKNIIFNIILSIFTLAVAWMSYAGR